MGQPECVSISFHVPYKNWKGIYAGKGGEGNSVPRVKFWFIFSDPSFERPLGRLSLLTDHILPFHTMQTHFQ